MTLLLNMIVISYQYLCTRKLWVLFYIKSNRLNAFWTCQISKKKTCAFWAAFSLVQTSEGRATFTALLEPIKVGLKRVKICKSNLAARALIWLSRDGFMNMHYIMWFFDIDYDWTFDQPRIQSDQSQNIRLSHVSTLHTYYANNLVDHAWRKKQRVFYNGNITNDPNLWLAGTMYTVNRIGNLAAWW